MPSLFTITGIQKSGNTWLTAMVGALPGVTLRAANVDLPFQLRCVGRFADGYNRRVPRSARLDPQSVAKVLLTGQSEDAVPVAFPSVAEQAMHSLAGQMVFDGSKGLSPSCTSTDTVVPAMLAQMSGSGMTPQRNVKSCGAVGKHLPVDQLQRQFPCFRVIWVVRDPRDVLISWFYHDLRAMTPHKARHFIAKPVGARVLRRLGLIDSARIPLQLRSDWKLRYFACRAEEICRFFAGGWNRRHQCLLVRYEDLLADCEGQLVRIADFLGVTPGTAKLHDIANRFSFSELTGGSAEVRGGHVRRGRSGDWINYFDHELLSALPPEFFRLVRQLDYEHTNDWADRIPAVAQRQLEKQRLNVHGSAVRACSSYWKEDSGLQKRFPQPINNLGPNSFCTWLHASPLPRVRECLHQLNWLSEQWGQLQDAERPQADRKIFEGHLQASKAA